MTDFGEVNLSLSDSELDRILDDMNQERFVSFILSTEVKY